MKLSDEFSKERNLLIINSFIILLYIFDIKFQTKIPFLNIENISKENSLFIFLFLNIYFIFRLIIEWSKSDKEATKKKSFKFDFYISLFIGIVSTFGLIYTLTNTHDIWNFPISLFFIILTIGEFSASTLSYYIEHLVYIRSKEESINSGLPRIPNMIRKQSIWIPINITIVSITLICIFYFTDKSIHFNAYNIFVVPFFIHLLFLIYYFLFPNIKLRSDIQKIYDQHDRQYQIIDIDKGLLEKKDELCRETTKEEYDEIEKNLKDGLDPNVSLNTGGWTLFLLSVANGDEKLVKLLLEYGADVNSENVMGRTALCFACNYGFYDLAKLLINKGAKINIKDQGTYASSPIIVASINGHLKIVELLIQNNANINISDFDGKTALDYAEENKFGDIAKILRKSKYANKYEETNNLP